MLLNNDDIIKMKRQSNIDWNREVVEVEVDLLVGRVVEIVEVVAAVVHPEIQEEAVDASMLEEVAVVVVETVQIAEVEVLQ